MLLIEADGKALLAERGGDLPSPLVALTPRTITRPQQLRTELDAVRARGYAVDREENATGITCFAVALPTTWPPVDAVSVSVPVARVTPALEKQIVQALLRHRL